MVGIAYITPSRIPGTAANAMQAMKMAQTLMEMDPGLLAVAAAGNGAADGASLRSLYGLQRLPDLSLFSASGRLGIHRFNLRAALAARRRGARLVLSRSIGAAAIAARLGIPTIFECHAPPQGFERRYWKWLVRAPGFRRIAVISNALKRLIEELHPEAKALDMIVVPDGVDLDRFENLPTATEAKHRAGRAPDRPVAGYAGHLYAGRGIGVILSIADRLPHWDFVLAGGTEADIVSVRDEVARLGLDNVELLGFVPNAKLADRLAVADVLLMPYQKEVMVSGGRLDTVRWMSPLKMFEYMAMDRAIIASDLPVLREVLDDSTARLVAPDDDAVWVRALSDFETKDTRRRLAHSAREAVAQYDWRLRCTRMLDGLLPEHTAWR